MTDTNARPLCSRCRQPMPRRPPSRQGRYCSAACYLFAVRRRWPARVCPECQTEWQPTDWLSSQRKTCGVLCGQRMAGRRGSEATRSLSAAGRIKIVTRDRPPTVMRPPSSRLAALRVFGVDPYGRRSLALTTSDGVVTLAIGEWAGASVPDDDIGDVRRALVDVLRGCLVGSGS